MLSREKEEKHGRQEKTSECVGNLDIKTSAPTNIYSLIENVFDLNNREDFMAPRNTLNDAIHK